MFYLCGDNDLEKYTIQIINDLEYGFDLSKNVSIIVLIDRIQGQDKSNGDLTGTYLYEISSDKKSKTNSKLLQDYGERNMGLQSTLELLINYGFANFTAEHYFLSLYDHGGGLSGICYDDTSKTEYSTSKLEISEIKHAIDFTCFYHKKNIDVLNLAGCLMGEIEVAYELRDSADYLIFSQNFGLGDFTDWQIFLENIYSEIYLSPYKLTYHFIHAYSQDHISKDKTTCSVIDLSKLEELFSSIENFSNNLTLTLFDMNHNAILNAREKSSSFKYKYVDLVDFLQVLLSNKTFMSEYQDLEFSIKKLIEKTQEIILFNYQNRGYSGTANGISIYFLYPYSINRGYESYSKYSSAYNLQFIDESSWVRFLNFLYSNDTDHDRLPDWFEIRYDLNHLSNDTNNNGICDNDEDFDSDLLDNFDEYFYGASPYLIDTDKDGMNDYTEIRENVNKSYPFTWDSDLDDFSDWLEVNFLKTNPLDINDPKLDFGFYRFLTFAIPLVCVFMVISISIIILDRRSDKFKKCLRNQMRGVSKGYQEEDEEFQEEMRKGLKETQEPKEVT